MKKLSKFNYLHIEMMKISFRIIRHHYFILATIRNLYTCVCIYVNICLNKNKSLYNKTWRSFSNTGKKYIYKMKKYLTRWLLKLKSWTHSSFFEAFCGIFTTQSNISDRAFIEIFNAIKPLTIFTNGFILNVWLGSKYIFIFWKYLKTKDFVISSLYLNL